MSHLTIYQLPLPLSNRIGWPWTEVSPQLRDSMPDSRPWPRISIVTPSFNQVQFLEETIRSVVLQGYPNLEYIIMDGGSTDGSLEILRKYEPWLSYWISRPDEGQAAALREGFERSTGEILAWINSDDRYLPGSLARVGCFFSSNPRIVFGNGDVNVMDAEGHYIRRIYAVPPAPFLTANLGIHTWPQQGCFWRRRTYEQSGGIDISFRFCMDRDLFIRLTRMGASHRIPGMPLASFRTHVAAKSSTILDVAHAEGDVLLSRYGSETLASHRVFLQFLWWIWIKPTNFRARINRWLGLEW